MCYWNNKLDWLIDWLRRRGKGEVGRTSLSATPVKWVLTRCLCVKLNMKTLQPSDVRCWRTSLRSDCLLITRRLADKWTCHFFVVVDRRTLVAQSSPISRKSQHGCDETGNFYLQIQYPEFVRLWRVALRGWHSNTRRIFCLNIQGSTDAEISRLSSQLQTQFSILNRYPRPVA